MRNLPVKHIFDPDDIDIQIDIEPHDHKPASFDGLRCRFCNEKLMYDAEWDAWLLEQEYCTIYSYRTDWLEWLRQLNPPSKNITRLMYELSCKEAMFLSYDSGSEETQ